MPRYVYSKGEHTKSTPVQNINFELGPNGSFGHLKASDWQGIKGVASEADKLPKANDIVLLHDRQWSGKQSLLKTIFSRLTGAGFTFGQLNDSVNARETAL